MKPPALAALLLQTFGSGDSIPSLLGDLIEEYRHGRLKLWFWRQAVAGIVVTFIAELRSHPYLALRAVVLGWVAWLAAPRVVMWVVVAMEVYLPAYAPSLALTTRGDYVLWDPFVRLFVTLVGAGAVGAIVGRQHRRSSVAPVLAFTMTVAAYFVYLDLLPPQDLPPGARAMGVWWVHAWTIQLTPCFILVTMLASGVAASRTARRVRAAPA